MYCTQSSVSGENCIKGGGGRGGGVMHSSRVLAIVEPVCETVCIITIVFVCQVFVYLVENIVDVEYVIPLS